MTPISDAVRALRAPDTVAAGYLEFHRRRYEYLLETVAGLGPERARILDVGLGFQTLAMRALWPEAKLATLGFYDWRYSPGEDVPHTEFDLNASNAPELGEFDVIVMAEVIEHLYAPPSRVLRMMRGLLAPGGHLVIQTPNPVNLARRLALLRGQSPFEVIRDDPKNPGHYCEYTVEDLTTLARGAEFDVASVAVKNYLGTPKPLFDLACAVLPGRMEEGITMVLRRPYS